MRLHYGWAGGLRDHHAFGLQIGKKCFECKPLIELLRGPQSSTFGKYLILLIAKRLKYEFPVYLWMPRSAEFLTIDRKISLNACWAGAEDGSYG